MKNNKHKVVKKGIQPLTYGLEDHCSMQLSYLTKKASTVFTDSRSKNDKYIINISILNNHHRRHCKSTFIINKWMHCYFHAKIFLQASLEILLV